MLTMPVYRTGFAVTGLFALFLNLVLSEEVEDEAPIFTANDADAAADREEWDRIKHGKGAEESDSSEKHTDLEASAEKS